MKPGAYFINNSRGTVVDLDALAAALQRQASGRCRRRRVSRRALVQRRQVRQSAAGPRQRHPDAAHRRLDGGGAGAHRRGGGAQVRRLLRQRLDHRRGELPAGAVAAAVLRHALHPRASQRAGRPRPAQRGLRPARHQRRRAVLPDRQRDRLRRDGRREARCRTPRACWPTSAPSPAPSARGCA